MSTDEIFESSVRSSGDLAGVFEYDGDTAYFYLYKIENESGQKVMSAIQIVFGQSNISQTNVAVRWDASETKVGLFINNQLCAAFDSSGNKYGGDCRKSMQTQIPPEVFTTLSPLVRP